MHNLNLFGKCHSQVVRRFDSVMIEVVRKPFPLINYLQTTEMRPSEEVL